jgi:hypothetical protein
MAEMAKDPLRLMPLDDLKKVVAQIAKLPKEAVEGVMPKRPGKEEGPRRSGARD